LLDLPDQEIKDLSAQAKDLSIETLLDYVDFMSAGDEEVAGSPNPRFSLEAALVRLSLMPKSLPVAALVERLERLEAKLTIPGAQSTESRPSESARAVVPASAERASAPREESDSKTRLWQDFVAFVGKQKKFLASHLASGSALELSAGTLKIGVAERHHLRYLQDPDNLVALRSLASQFFSGEVMISVSALAAEPATSLGETTAGAAGGKTDARSEMVSEALRILGGSIRTVRREN
jgi:DNA polymerase-3 subunit gamma/tau